MAQGCFTHPGLRGGPVPGAAQLEDTCPLERDGGSQCPGSVRTRYEPPHCLSEPPPYRSPHPWCESPQQETHNEPRPGPGSCPRPNIRDWFVGRIVACEHERAATETREAQGTSRFPYPVTSASILRPSRSPRTTLHTPRRQLARTNLADGRRVHITDLARPMNP